MRPVKSITRSSSTIDPTLDPFDPDRQPKPISNHHPSSSTNNKRSNANQIQTLPHIKRTKLLAQSALKPDPNPPHLPFSLSTARAYLISLDPRFQILFDKLPCKPFELSSENSSTPKTGDPFRSLSSSILGQQVSCLAAKSITYRFIRLFHPSLPEKLDPSLSVSTQPFPTPAQVAEMPTEKLRTAGLSQRKAEYIRDLAERFVDGRLCAEALMSMDAKSVMNELCAVRGIGRWTVEMFLIFTVKNPDILPCADLAIQKGILRWYTSTDLNPSPKKPKPKPIKIKSEVNLKTVNWTDLPAAPIPTGCSLSLSDLKNRLIKPLKPGLYLTPLEMEQLAEPWKPYRSIPVCYFWSMTDVPPDY